MKKQESDDVEMHGRCLGVLWWGVQKRFVMSDEWRGEMRKENEWWCEEASVAVA